MTAKPSCHSTRWSVIRRAQAGGPEARAALEQLVRRYDTFIEAALRRARRPPDLTVEDAKQEFLEQLLKDLPRVVEGRGRFRGWLSCAMHSYICNARRRWWAKSNPGPATDCSDILEPSTSYTAEHELLRTFAIDTLKHAARLQRSRSSNRERFEALRHFLPGPDMNLEEIASVSRRLGLTAVATRKAIYDLRTQFRECLNEAVADTLEPDEVSDEGEREQAVQRELRQLCTSLCEEWVSEAAFGR
ncbi:MAG: polymerase sigma factor [Polyangiaceae bacterium]|nr:polymerase sigma factor [Polyangiaceae bacterium]